MASSLASTSRAVLGTQSGRRGLSAARTVRQAPAAVPGTAVYAASSWHTRRSGFVTSAAAKQEASSLNAASLTADEATKTAFGGLGHAQREGQTTQGASDAFEVDAQAASSTSSASTPFDRKRRRMHMQQARLEEIGRLGSTQTKPSSYKPYQGRLDPVTARDLTISHLMAATAHLGHNKSSLQRASAAFAYGTRHGQVIIDVERYTLPALKLAAKVVSKVVYHDGVVVFLGTRPHMQDFVLAAAKRLGRNGYHITKDKWQPGTLTNAPKLLSRAVLADMERYEEEYANSPEGNQRNAPELDTAKLASQTLQPDLLIVLNPRENVHAIREATQLGVPTIGIIDTDVDPRLVTYPIPANDDALTAVELIAGVLSKAGQAALEERKRVEDEADKRVRNSARARR